MTIASQTSRISYLGDGSTTAFPVPFYFAANADMVVILQDTAGNQTTQILGTNYTLTGATLAGGGTCTFTVAPTTGYLVSIYRDPAVTQTTSYNNNDPFPAKSHELALDKLTTLAQRTRDIVSRAIHLPDGEGNTSTTLATIANRKNKLLGFGTNGELVYPLGPTFVGNSATGAAIVDSRATAQVTVFTGSVNFIRTGGYAGTGDGGGALYKRVVSQPSHAGKFQSADGAWWEIAETIIDIRMVGAIADGNSANSSVNANAVRAALTLRNCAMIPATSSGFHFGAEVITVGNGQFVCGFNGSALVKSSSVRLFKMTGNDDANNQWNGITDLTIDMTDASSGSTAIRYATSETVCSRSRIARCVFVKCYEAIGQDVGGTYIFHCLWEDLKCNYPRGRQIYSPLSRGFVYLRKIDCDNTLSITPAIAWETIVFNDFIGVFLEDVTVTGQAAQVGNAGYNSAAVGIKISGNKPAGGYRHVWMDRVRVESSTGPGIQIFNATFINGNDVEAFACFGLAIDVESVDLVQGTRWAARGGNDISGVASANGLSFVGCTKVIIDNIRSGQNTGHGLFVNNTSESVFTGVYTESNTGVGLVEGGTSNANTFLGYVSESDTGGPISLVGSSTYLGPYTVNGVRSSAQHFSANKAAVDQAISVFGSFQKVTVTSEASDPRGLYDAANSRAAPTKGTWRLQAKVTISAGIVAGVEYVLAIYKSGSALELARYRPAYTNAFTMALNADVEADGSFYEVYVYAASGTGSYTVSGAIGETSFSGYMV